MQNQPYVYCLNATMFYLKSCVSKSCHAHPLRPGAHPLKLILGGGGIQTDGFWTGVVHKRIDFTREWYTKGWILDGNGIQKERFLTGVVYTSMDFTREWYTKGWILNRRGIQKDRF